MPVPLLKSLPNLRGSQLDFPLSVKDEQPSQLPLEALQFNVAAIGGVVRCRETTSGYCAVGIKQGLV